MKGGASNSKGVWGKGGGKGYQGTCWTCGQVGHKSGEGKCGGKGGVDRAVQEVEEERGIAVQGVEIGGLWSICHVAKEERNKEIQCTMIGAQRTMVGRASSNRFAVLAEDVEAEAEEAIETPPGLEAWDKVSGADGEQGTGQGCMQSTVVGLQTIMVGPQEGSNKETVKPQE